MRFSLRKTRSGIDLVLPDAEPLRPNEKLSVTASMERGLVVSRRSPLSTDVRRIMDGMMNKYGNAMATLAKR